MSVYTHIGGVLRLDRAAFNAIMRTPAAEYIDAVYRSGRIGADSNGTHIDLTFQGNYQNLNRHLVTALLSAMDAGEVEGVLDLSHTDGTHVREVLVLRDRKILAGSDHCFRVPLDLRATTSREVPLTGSAVLTVLVENGPGIMVVTGDEDAECVCAGADDVNLDEGERCDAGENPPQIAGAVDVSSLVPSGTVWPAPNRLTSDPAAVDRLLGLAAEHRDVRITVGALLKKAGAATNGDPYLRWAQLWPEVNGPIVATAAPAPDRALDLDVGDWAPVVIPYGPSHSHLLFTVRPATDGDLDDPDRYQWVLPADGYSILRMAASLTTQNISLPEAVTMARAAHLEPPT